MRLGLPLVSSLLSLAALPARADCPMDLGHGTGWVVFSEHYMIAFRPDPMRVEIGQPFDLILNACTRSGEGAELVGVDVDVSDEGRGVAQHLKIVPGLDGRYRAEGLVLVARGRWEVDFDVRSGGEIERLTHEIVLK
ncbi:MAG: hypothetical protein ACHQK9_13985 [Reyranellales bacterium]